jgi:hypothetical protein
VIPKPASSILAKKIEISSFNEEAAPMPSYSDTEEAGLP